MAFKFASRMRANYLGIPAFFGIKVLSGLILLKLSAVCLSVGDFTVFSQLFLFSALLNMIAVGGSQNGIIRQVAAASNDQSVSDISAAAYSIWAAASAIILAVSFGFTSQIASFLTGAARHGWAVIWVAVLSVAGAPGQIFCSILTGKGLSAKSLFAQGCGLVCGSFAASLLLAARQPAWAVIAFCGGQAISAIVAALFLGRVRPVQLRKEKVVSEVASLCRYSAAFVVVALTSSLTLFALRYVYRESFDAQQLGYWLVANRISDTSTQLLGLYMSQIFLPAYAAHAGDSESSRILKRNWAVATGAMTTLPIIFLIAPEFFLGLFVSVKYVPAISAIAIYMAGDAFRATTSLAVHAAFAKGRLTRYVLIEISSLGIFGALALITMRLGIADGPFFSYASGYAIAAIVILGAYLTRGSGESRKA